MAALVLSTTAGLAGCGTVAGSPTGTGTTARPTITSFTANEASITAGASSMLA